MFHTKQSTFYYISLTTGENGLKPVTVREQPRP